MSYQVTDCEGVTYLRPKHAVMVEVVKTMYDRNEDVFGDVIMTDSQGVSISLHPNGTATFETHETNDYRMIRNLSLEEQLTLWIQLAAGNVQAIEKLDWEQG